MGNQMRLLSKPNTECDFESGTGETFIYTAASMQGWRKYQEDRYVCVPEFSEECNFFGVFDGHGGSEIAEFLKRRLHLEILDSLQTECDIELALHSGFLSCDASLREPAIIAELNYLIDEENKAALQILRTQETLDADMFEAAEEQSNIAGPSGKSTFTENFHCSGNLGGTVNHLFLKNIARSTMENETYLHDSEEMQVESPLEYLLSDDIESSDPGDDDYIVEEDEDFSSNESSGSEGGIISSKEFFNQEPGFLSGSTATVAIIHQNRIYVANVGDSRCVLSRKGRAVDLSLDHKPDDPEEHTRIIGAGGSISDDGRVNGCLNLSRAFGDFKFKGSSLEPSQQCITAEPFIKSINIEKDDNFLIIASDGIWNSMSSQEVVDFIEIRLHDGHCNLEDICEEMFRLTLAADTNNDGSGCDNMCCIIIKFNKKDDSSFIYKARVSNKVVSSDSSLKQGGKNVNAPTIDSADQMTSIPEKTSLVDEKSIHQNSCNSHLTAQFIKQNLKSSHWVDCDIKKIASNFSQNDMQYSVCSLRQKETLKIPETVIPPIFEDKSTYGKGKCLKKPVQLDNITDTDSTNSYMEQIVHNLKNAQLEKVFLGFQINNVVNLAGSYLQNMMVGTY